MKNSLAKISDYPLERISVDDAWQSVVSSLNIVVTLNKITPKAIPRSGIAMTNALYELLDALKIYQEARK